MNNFTPISKRNQEENKIFPPSSTIPSADDRQKPFRATKVGSLCNEDITRIKRQLWAIGYTDRRMKVVEVVLSFFTRYAYCYFKLDQIAEYAGVSRTTVETVMRDLQSMGFYKQDRRWRQYIVDGAAVSREVNSQWWLSDLFRDRNVLISLSYYFPFLKKFRALPLLMILSCSAQDSFEASRTAVRHFEYLSYIKDFIYKTGTDTELRNERVTVGHPPHQYSHGAQMKSTTGERSSVRLEKREKRSSMYAKSIDAIRSLVLTDKGKAELSCFSESAITYTDGQLYKKLQRESFSAVSAWKWFCKVATRYSKENNLPLDYGLTYHLSSDGNFKITDANVQAVAQVTKQRSSDSPSREKTQTITQPDRTPEVLARIKAQPVTDEDQERIEHKIKFFTAALKAARESHDAQSKRCIPFYEIMLNGWQEKKQELGEQSQRVECDSSPDRVPNNRDNFLQEANEKPLLSDISGENNIMSKKEFVFGVDDAPISECDLDEESPWI